MKNLWQTSNEFWPISGACTRDSEQIFILSDPTHLHILKNSSSKVHILDTPISELIDMTYLQLEEKLMFITSSSLISYSPGTKECITEGEMTCQINSAKWSPSQECLVLFLSNASIILQNQELEVVKSIKVNEKLVGGGSIAWRNDSKYFQVCFHMEGGIKVLGFTGKGEAIEPTVTSDVEGPVQSVYDKASLLDSSKVSWHSALIAGVCKQKLVFWEKNGMKHGEMQVLGCVVTSLEWSYNGKLLAVGTDLGLEIYHLSNNHWYLKYFIKNGKSIHWDADFLLISHENGLQKLSFAARYDCYNDTVAVVDGLDLHLTYFSRGMLPPPMSHTSYRLTSVPSSICVTGDAVFVVTDKVYSYPTGEVLYQSGVDLVYSFKALVFAAVKNRLFAVKDEKLEEIQEYQADIVTIFSSAEKIFVQLSNGEVHGEGVRICKVPAVCQQLYALEIQGRTDIIGLAGLVLYINDKIFCATCTSVLVASGFLFFIKRDAPFDTLFIFHHSDLPWAGPLPDPSSEHFYSRSVEKTSNIVCLSGSNLVLLHSRGNLETIAPRLFMLHKIRALVLEKNYLQAFTLLRKHKIDLNLLCDISPTAFDAHLFTQQVQKPEFINLFLTSLKDTDSLSKFFHTSPLDLSGKSNRISDEIRRHLDPSTHLLSILTSFVTKSPPEIESALKLVQELRRHSAAKPPRPPHETSAQATHKIYAEDAIKYLSWLVNPDRLYNVALGMYDLDLTSQLAKYTQKDPKDYLPYLQGLSQMPAVLMRYQINCDLKNYSGALKELVEGGEAYRSQCIDLIRSQKLFLQAMELLQGTDVLAAIAEALSKLDHPLQAAAMYECCGDYEKARDLYLLCEEWELACKMGDILGTDLRETISSRCAELGRFESAASIAVGHAEEHLVIKFLVQAGKYKQAAISTKTSEGRALLRSTLKNYAGDMVEDIGKSLKIWAEKKNRLAMVQQNKKLAPESSHVMNDETASQYSLDSSMSRATQFTKKQRKKAKKVRKAAAKEGSQYEEDYLVDLLVTLRPDIVHLEKVESLCMGLVFVGEFVTAYRLWSCLEELRNTTYVPISTLRQQEFIKRFYGTFPEIGRGEENESRLMDMFAKSTFLPDGLASHKLPVFNSRLQTFFKTLAHK